MFKKYALLSGILLLFLLQAKPAQAQDIGVPIFKKLSFYTIAGGVGGTGLSVVWWLTDPLNPSISFKENLMTGFALGTFVGFVVGINVILTDRVQTELDYQYDQIDEFYGLRYRGPPPPSAFMADETMISDRFRSRNFKFETKLFETRF